MKLNIIPILLLMSNIVHGQSIGIKLNPHIATSPSIKSPSVSWSAGLYFDQPLFDQITLMTGIDFVQYDLMDVKPFPVCLCDTITCKCPNRIDYYYEVVELPIFFSYNLSKLKNELHVFYFSAGASVSTILGFHKVARGGSEGNRITPVKFGQHIPIIYGCGIEYQYLPLNYSTAVGIRLRYATNVYKSPGFADWSLYAKFGFKLGKRQNEVLNLTE